MGVKISVVVPVYNAERYLKRCIESLVCQSFEDFEIILVDDGSTDGSSRLCDLYAESNEKVRAIHRENGGLGAARNSGLEAAVGEYVLFTDSDDYVSADMLEKLYAATAEYGADAVYGGMCYDTKGRITRSQGVGSLTVWRGENRVMELLLDLIAVKPGKTKDTIMEISACRALFRRTIFEKNHIRFVSEREFISEDLIFDMDFLPRCGCVAAIPDAVYFYTFNPKSLSKSFRTDRFKRDKELYFEVIRRLSKLYSEDEFALRCDRFLIARARFDARNIVRHRAQLSTGELREALCEICGDRDLQRILKRYPIWKLPCQQTAAALLMKLRCVSLLALLMRL